jgi:glucans biosynthesis protein C
MQRLPHLDALRVFAFALLIPYHVGMYYVSWDWHVKSPAASHTLEPFMLMSAPWRLGLLFFVGGVACQGLLARTGHWGFVRERSRRLLLPLLFGMAVVVTPQAYFEVLTQAPQLLPGDGGYLDFWAAYLQGGRYCDLEGCMVVPTWNHLWFLPYLWLYALLAVPLAVWLRLPGALPAWAWLVGPAVLLALLRLALFPHFPSTHDLVHDLYNHAQYGLLFGLGWATRTDWGAGFWPLALRQRWPALLLCLGCWAALALYMSAFQTDEPPPALLSLMRVVRAVFGWAAVLAACGWAQRFFRTEHRWLREASGAVFCLYVLHQSVIVVLSQWLRPLALPWGVEALLLIGLTFALCGLAYRLLRGVPGLRTLVGISAPGQGRPGPTAAA